VRASPEERLAARHQRPSFRGTLASSGGPIRFSLPPPQDSREHPASQLGSRRSRFHAIALLRSREVRSTAAGRGWRVLRQMWFHRLRKPSCAGTRRRGPGAASRPLARARVRPQLSVDSPTPFRDLKHDAHPIALLAWILLSMRSAGPDSPLATTVRGFERSSAIQSERVASVAWPLHGPLID
jgi:hypothetical protein